MAGDPAHDAIDGQAGDEIGLCISCPSPKQAILFADRVDYG